MKMKRALKCIGAVALAASLMMVPSMIPVQASNGPCMEGEFAFANIQLNDTVVFSTNEKNTVDGASYDQASNTLTLTNWNLAWRLGRLPDNLRFRKPYHQ